MAWLVGHREPKGAETAMLRLPPPRQSSTLPVPAGVSGTLNGGFLIFLLRKRPAKMVEGQQASIPIQLLLIQITRAGSLRSVDDQLSLRRRAKPSPARPMPSSASVAGSGAGDGWGIG